jgi:hypothetical protein
MQQFRVSDCTWLNPGPASKAKAGTSKSALPPHAPPSDAIKRLQVLEEFIFWYFDGFVQPLLKVDILRSEGFLRLHETDNILQTTFYVTESSAFRNRVLFFRQDDWAELCKPLIAKLAGNTFERLDAVRVCVLPLHVKTLNCAQSGRGGGASSPTQVGLLIREAVTERYWREANSESEAEEDCEGSARVLVNGTAQLSLSSGFKLENGAVDQPDLAGCFPDLIL